MDNKEIQFHAIGTVRNNVMEQKDVDWGEEISQIILNENLEKGLMGLEDFSNVIIIFHLDQAKYDEEKHVVRKPQGREDMPMIGILAQRAKDRPNPIGITTVQLLKVEKNRITVKGLDAIDGTPIIDIKPYYPIYDSRPDAKVPTWVDKLMEHYFS